ncbi:MAG TPA: glycosyltransferase family A protein [Sphingomonas sp.]
MREPAEHPLISVIVPAYGVAHLLEEALRSLQSQTVDSWEAIVVDDGAPDDVAGALEPFAGDPRIRFLKTDNGGLAMARNRAAAIARAPLIALLDGDDAYEPDYIEAMLAGFERDPQLGFLSCDARFTGLTDRAGQLFSAFHGQAGEVTLARVLARDVNIFVGCTIRRDAFDAVDGFDGALRSVEDLDLWVRLLAAGYRGAILARPLVRYRRRPGSLSSNRRTMAASSRIVYGKAMAALAGRPERAVAARMAATLDSERAWIEGEDLILAGEARRGLALLRGIERRSLRWRLAMPVMRLMPALARPLLRMRPALPEPRQR